MKILHVHTDLLGGGIEGMIVTLATTTKSLIETEVGICWCPTNHPAPPADFLQLLEQKGIELFRISPPFLSPCYPWRLLKVIHRFRPDVLHLHGTTLGVLGGIIGKILRLPVIVYTEHVSLLLVPKWLRQARKLTAHLPHWTVFVSSSLRNETVEKNLLPQIKNRSSVIHNGIDLSEYLRVSSLPNKISLLKNKKLNPTQQLTIFSLKKELGLEADTILVGNIGLFWPVKGQEFLIRAMARIEEKKRKNPIHIVLVGRGENEDRLRSLAQELDIREKIHFLGWRKDIPNILQALDIYVQPSLSEGLPLAVVEACAAGLPIIASNVGGIPEIIRDNIDGLLVPPANEQAIAEAIVKLLSNPDLATRLAQQAQKRAFSEFSAEAMTTKYVDLYFDLLKRRRSKL